MEETEKMTALKKAYAEIILNTAKEAATRIMLSERKAHQFHHDLSTTKEEALRLLFRLKQTMDSKISEVEIKSLNQQRKIEELEAQLQEAEDIVSNLRAELNEAHMKLEEMASDQMYSGPKLMDNAVCKDGSAQPENRLSEAVLASEVKLSNGANGHSVANNSLEEYGHSGEPDVPSIIIRRKQHELYRNGCTQRIRACEGNLLNGHCSLARGSDHLKNVKVIKQDKEGEEICITTLTGAETMCIKEQKYVDTKEVKYLDKGACKMQALKSFRKKRKRASRFKRSKASTNKGVLPVPKEAHSDLFNSKACLPADDICESLDKEGEGTKSYICLTAPFNISEMGALSEHVASVQGDDRFTESCVEDLNGDKEVACSLVSITQQSTSGVSSDIPSSKPEFEMKSSSSINLDATELEACDGFPSPPPKDRVLKYTFQRKRKKESSVTDDSSLLHHEEPLGREMVTKQNSSLDPLKSSSVTESSRDSRRMAQVARQLISLSEKKWWK